MYIAPNTNIYILHNIPLDNTYRNTLYFDSVAKQFGYFGSKTKYTLNNQSYQRVNRNRIRIEKTAEDLYDCNYIMFQNKAFGDKWFYAFITKPAEFVNNLVSEIEYEIDVMQTWAFDYTLKSCFVEREHSETDTAGDNTVPENLELGEYVLDGLANIPELAAGEIVVATTFDSAYNDAVGGMYGGLFSGCVFHGWPNTPAGATAAQQFILGASAKADGIVSVFMMHQAFLQTVGTSGPKSVQHTSAKPTAIKRADGTDAKNKKLLTYPYNFLYVMNNQGGHAEYNFEDFSTDDCEFVLVGDMSNSPGVYMIPKSYKGIETNANEKLSLTNMPNLCYATDAYKAWLAQNGSNAATNAISGAVRGALAGGPVGALAGAAGGLLPTLTGAATQEILKQVAPAYAMPLHATVTAGPTTQAAAGMFNFLYGTMHIKPQFVSIIDDYFTMYGYACHRVKVPNRDARPKWNYVKTVGCNAIGNVPVDDMSRIKQAYDNGITFWKNPAEVGDYTLDNGVS